jgi:hypothetical protein
MRLIWLAAISVLAAVMGVLTPYVLRTESTWQAAAWLDARGANKPTG